MSQQIERNQRQSENEYNYFDREDLKKQQKEKNESKNSFFNVPSDIKQKFGKIVIIVGLSLFLLYFYEVNTIKPESPREEKVVVEVEEKKFDQTKFNQTKEFEDGGKFFGSTLSDKPQGYGECYWPDGSSYTGQWEFGQKHGNGVFKDYDGSTYEGNWRHNQKSGYGNFISSLYSYSGHYVDGLKEGQGIQKYPNSLIYNGTFKNDALNGYGTEENLEEVYNGEWENGKKSGKGFKKYENGDTYDGIWKNGKREGKGIFTSQDGTYDGDWANDEKNGKGVLHFPNIYRYQGGWKNNLFHGFGKLEVKGKSKQEGEWYFGKMQGKGKVEFLQPQERKPEKIHEIAKIGDKTFENTQKNFIGVQSFSGELKDNKPFGKGIVEYFSGEMFEGNFDSNGKRSGYGESLINDYKYYGNWKRNLKEGEGEEIDDKGIYEGSFKNGQKHGKGSYTFKSDSKKYEGEFDQGKYICPYWLGFGCREI